MNDPMLLIPSVNISLRGYRQPHGRTLVRPSYLMTWSDVPMNTGSFSLLVIVFFLLCGWFLLHPIMFWGPPHSISVLLCWAWIILILWCCVYVRCFGFEAVFLSSPILQNLWPLFNMLLRGSSIKSSICELSSLSRVQTPFYSFANTWAPSEHHWSYVPSPACYNNFSIVSFEWCKFNFCIPFSFSWISFWNAQIICDHPVYFLPDSHGCWICNLFHKNGSETSLSLYGKNINWVCENSAL